MVTELGKLIEQDLLEYIPPGGGTWVSHIVVVRKSNRDIRIVCGDYKIGVNHKVYLDSYPILNVEVSLRAFLKKIDLKVAHHQIPIDNNVHKYANWVTKREKDAME